MNDVLLNPELWGRGQIMTVLVGVVLLLAGRKLVWLAVAALGFLAGWWLAANFGTTSEEMRWVLGLLLGVGGVILAVMLKKLAIAVAGALLGGIAASRWVADGSTGLDQALGSHNQALIIALVVGAVLGALLATALFAIAVAAITAGTGGLLLSGLLPVSAPLQLLAALILAVVGMIIQLVPGRRAAKPKPT